VCFLSPAARPGELGRLGKYSILGVLGRGGMGVVFRAEDTVLQRQVAIKAMLPGVAAAANGGERFLREARAMAAVENDHVVRVYQADEERGVPYLAMELLRGETLEERLKREKALPVPEAVRIAREMAEGLAAAHQKGLIHRDVKPGNVWLESPRGRVKILDFGLARAASGDARITQQGAILGTPAYMSPEQAQSGEVGPWSDLFSLGAVLYRMLTGAQPFQGKDAISTLMEVASHHPAQPAQVRQEVPAELSALVMRLLEKDRSARPESAEALARELQAVEEAVLRGGTLPRPGAAPPRKGPAAWMAWAGAGAAAACLVSVVAFFLVRGRQEAGGPPSNPGEEEWVKEVEALPLEQRARAVVRRLMDLNPGFSASDASWELEEERLNALSVRAARVADISPLRALKGLRKLTLDGTSDVPSPVTQLAPLAGLGLTYLSIRNVAATDLSPLAGMPLEEVWCDFIPERDARVFRPMKTLRKINGLPTDRVWTDHDWAQKTARLPGDRLALAVMGRLKERSPELLLFIKPRIEGGKIVELNVPLRACKDLWPLRALPDLRVLGGEARKGLKRAPDLADLSPLRGLPLNALGLEGSAVSDLAPLRGMPLERLSLRQTRVTSLAPLAGMPLTSLDIAQTQVSDLSPLRGMKLTSLHLEGTRVADLSLLAGMPLREVWADQKVVRSSEVLRGVKTLEKVNGKPAAEAFAPPGKGS
jgi:Leucine-rich repeat (LRR) protein